MTPAERLLKAAELLEKRASKATEGAWAYEMLPSRWTGDRDAHWVRFERQDSDGGATSGVVIDAVWGEADARYIATVHPGVAKALAELLRGVATGYASADAMMNDGWSPEARERIIAANRPGLDQALALADLLLAGEQ